jgi:photosynthetic reaction center cytochrome c subunit
MKRTSRTLVSMRTVNVSLGLTLAATVMVLGQAQAPAGQPRMAEQQYKNIKVLTGTPANQLNLAMHGIAGALGTNCVHCHTWEQFDKDGKAPKEIARRMITMVREMNKSYFGGAQVITCYTCHRGSLRPVSIAELPDTIGLRPRTEPAPPLPTEEIIQKAPSYPSAESILAKYVQALGGEQAIRKVTSRVITAKRDYPAGAAGLEPVPAEVEIYEKAPNLTVMISKAEKFTVSEGFDGEVAWTQNANGGVANLPEPDQQRAKRGADFYDSLDIAQAYGGQLQVTGIEKVNGKDAYVLQGTPENDSMEKLYFDVKTGLLLRRWSTLPSSLMRYPYEIDYDDYRKTSGGAKIPFVIRTNPSIPRDEAATNSTLQIVRVQDNVPIAPGQFARPQPKTPAAPAGAAR